MSFKTDSGGIAFKCFDAKLQANASTWGTKLSQLAKQTGMVRIVTYSLPDMRYIVEQFRRRPQGIFLIANSKFIDRAREVQGYFPDISVAVHERSHSKVLLIEPETIVISSANFGDSDWHETSVSFHSKEAHDWYVKEVWNRLWEQSMFVQA